MTNKKAKQAGRPTNKNQKLSKQLVLQTALPLMTESGVEAVSFRKLAAALDATPMAVKYHVGSKQELLKGLVEMAFKDIASERAGDTPQDRLRNALALYCVRALENANLIRCILGDTSLMSRDIIELTNNFRLDTNLLNKGDQNDVMLNLLVDYTHGFVFAAASASPDNCPTIEGYLRSLDWVLASATNG